MAVARMKKRADFVAVQSSGRSKAASAFIILAIPGGEALSFGYTATKKLGNAVCRNRAKRRMRAVVHEVTKALPDLSPARVVLIARHSVLNAPFEKMVESLKAALPELLK